MKENLYLIGEGTLHFFFGVVSIFNRDTFFSKKLWRKVDGFQDKREDEVKRAFVSFWLHDRTGIESCPVGDSVEYRDGDYALFQAYMKEWQPLFDAYKKFVFAQL